MILAKNNSIKCSISTKNLGSLVPKPIGKATNYVQVTTRVEETAGAAVWIAAGVLCMIG